MGALLAHITGDAEAETYQPMNVNFGLFPPLDEAVRKKQRKEAYTARAKVDFGEWLDHVPARVADREGSERWAVHSTAVPG